MGVARALGLLVAVMMACAPSAGLLCHALCAPATQAAPMSCHDEMPAGPDGAVHAPDTCTPDAAVVVAVVDTGRAHAAAVPLPASRVAAQPPQSPASRAVSRPPGRQRPGPIPALTVVLRI